MIPISSETKARRRARRLAQQFQCPFGAWRCNDTPHTYAAMPVHAGTSLPGGLDRWELRYIAEPGGIVRQALLEVGAVAVLVAFLWFLWIS